MVTTLTYEDWTEYLHREHDNQNVLVDKDDDASNNTKSDDKDESSTEQGNKSNQQDDKDKQ